MVVVVQLLAADPEAPGRDVGRGIGRLEVAVSPVVAQAVDDAGGMDRTPQHLHRPDRQAERAEQRHVDDQHQRHAQRRAAGVEMALDPVVGRVVAVLLQRLGHLGLGAIELAAAQQHRLQAMRDRAVRVIDRLALGVVLAMDRDPFLRHHAGGHPQPETEEMRGDRPEVQRAMRLAAVQEDGDRDDRDVGHHEREQQHLPPGGVQQAMSQPVQQDCPDRREVGHRKDFQKRRKQAGCTAGEGRRRFGKRTGRRVRVTGGRTILAPPRGAAT